MRISHHLISGALLLIHLFFFITGCSEDRQSSTNGAGKKSLTLVDTVKVYFTDAGKLQAILYALRMEEVKGVTWGWDIRVDFFQDDDEKPDGYMVADSGMVKQGRGRRRSEVSVFGDVHLTAPDGTELFADSLRWNPRRQMVESNSDVRIVRGSEVVEGRGFTSDPNFNRIRVKSVRGKIEQ